MTPEQATEIATRARPAFGVEDEYTPISADRRIVAVVPTEPVADALPGPGRVKDVTGWVVRFGLEQLWAELTVDEATSEIVRFRRSR